MMLKASLGLLTAWMCTHLCMCHVDDCQLVKEPCPVRSLRLHLYQQAVYDPDEVCNSLLHLQDHK